MIKVLSVGASNEHIESIKIAKSLGYEVIAVDGNKNAEAFGYSDISLCLDIKNEEEVVKIAKKYDIKAVLPSPIGKLLTTVGAVNDALNLKGITKEAALNCVDKVRFNKCLLKAGIGCAKQAVADSKDEIINAIEKIGIPCILKPRFGSGSKGVIVIEKNEDVMSYVNEHYTKRGNDNTLVEELLSGKEYGVDGVIQEGKFKVVLIREKTMTDLPYRQETQYICPANITSELEDEIENVIDNACKTAKLDNCLINADVLVDNGKIYIIEMAGRPAGYFISKKIIPAVTGVNFLLEGIKLALNKKCDFTIKEKNILIVDFLDYIYGEILELPANSELEKLDFIYESNIHFKCGAVIKKITSGQDIYNRGYIILKLDNFDDILNKKEKIKKIIKS